MRWLLMWLLLFRGSSGEVSRERNTDFGGRNFSLLSGQRLLLQKLSLDLLLYLSQLLLLQLDSLQPLQDNARALTCLNQLGRHRDGG